MTNAKSTKRALLTSMMAMLLCFTMLLGTTYAWFTDSATSGSNVITAGNLDIEVQYTLGDKDENGDYVWNDLDGADDLFQKGLWEPGHTEVVALKIENKGSLALKYNASMNIVDETVGKTKDGKDIVLSDILTVSTLNVQAVDTDGNANQIGDITLGLAFNGENSVAYETTTTFKAGNVLRADKELQPGAAHYLIVKVDMAETVGNEANHDGVNVPSIEFGINVLATQYTKETDSFGPNYDKNAGYDEPWDGTTVTTPVADENGVYHITTAAELVGLMDVTGNSIYIGKTIVLDNNIDLAGKTVKGIGSDVTNFAGTFDGQGFTISNFKIDATNRGYYAGLFNQVSHGGTVKNLTVKNATVMGTSMVGAVASSVDGGTVDNCKAIDCTVIGVKKVGAVVGYSNGGTVTNNYAENCTVLYSTDNEAGEVLGYENTGSTVSNNDAKNVTVTMGALVSTADELKAAVTNGKKDIVVVGAELTEKISLGRDVNATFVDCTITGDNSYMYANNITFQNCTFKTGIWQSAIHLDTLSGKLVVNNCTFVSGQIKIGTSANASAVFNNCVFGATAPENGIWSEKGMRFYCEATFNNCEFNNRVVLAGSDNLPLTFNGCTMNGGDPVYFNAVNDGIIAGSALPNVTINN